MKKYLELKKIAVYSFALIGILSSFANANNCDSTCQTKRVESSFSKKTVESAIDSVADLGFSNKLESCLQGFKTQEGLDSYVVSRKRIAGLYAKNIKVSEKLGVEERLPETTCFSQLKRNVSCEVDFSGLRSQVSTLSHGANKVVSQGAWTTESSSCSKIETKSENCSAGYDGSVTYRRTISENNQGVKQYSDWAETGNTCKKSLPQNGLVTEILNGRLTSPITISRSYGGNLYSDLKLRDRNTVYVDIVGDHNYSNIRTASYAEELAIACELGFCGSRFDATVFRKGIFKNGVELAWFYGMSGLGGGMLHFNQYPRFDGFYDVGDSIYLANEIITYGCQNGYEPSKDLTYCTEVRPSLCTTELYFQKVTSICYIRDNDPRYFPGLVKVEPLPWPVHN